ncbi:gephyrin-like molybdotransferase Glp [Georgenia alba]|uniref:Molybdopterin molybdenumtransferase n=1 Tax=Georgenia alba TaxID=2233858 RepID=A0ABW2Q9V7_9MICO
MITVEEHRAAVLAQITPLPVRQLPLTEALGCRLVEDVVARVEVPPFDNSAMDGYAVLAADVADATESRPVRLRVVGDIPAGADALPRVGPGTAARIMTGAPIPPGADAVVPVERTDQPAGPADGKDAPEEVLIHAPAGSHVRRAGEDVTPGTQVLRGGRTVRPRDLATAASTGHGTLPVRPRVRLGVLTTGDELVAPGEPLGPGQIPESNNVLLLGLAEQLGATPVPLGILGDRPSELRDVLARRLGGVDALVTTGGVSAGAYDVVKEVLGPLGDVAFRAVAMQPGKPQGFGVLHDGERPVPIFCLPGNPVSVFVSFMVFVEPALRVMSGFARPDDADSLRPLLLDGVAATGWRSPPGRCQYIPVAFDGTDEEDDHLLRVRPSAERGSQSHLVASLAAAEALAIVDAEVESVAEGDAVTVMMVP